MLSCGCPSVQTLRALFRLAASVRFSTKKDTAARLLQCGAAYCRQRTCPSWPSPARRRRTHAPSRATPRHHPPCPFQKGRSVPAPSSTSPVSRKVRPAHALGCIHWAIDAPLTSVCCKRIFQMFQIYDTSVS
jgi:hypothetical protein